MKIVVFVIICVSLTACGVKSDKPEMDSVQDGSKDQTEKLIEENSSSDRFVKGMATALLVKAGDSSELYIDYMYYAQLDSIYKDSVNQQIRSFYLPYEERGSKDALTPAYFESKVDALKDEYTEFEMEMESATLWSFEENISIDDSMDTLVQISYSGWSYLGGAHGNGFDNNFVISKATGKPIALKDLFTDVEALTKIADPLFREQNVFEDQKNLSYEEIGYEFGEEGFYLNDNFTISESFIDFHYNSYEIGPYAMPPSDLRIPMKAIQHLLIAH